MGIIGKYKKHYIISNGIHKKNDEKHFLKISMVVHGNDNKIIGLKIKNIFSLKDRFHMNLF